MVFFVRIALKIGMIMHKITPLLVLAIFLAGVVWMIFGMKNAMHVTDHTKVKKMQATQEKE